MLFDKIYQFILFIICIIQAANPGAVLEDFIRWYSPRDWIEEEGLDEWGQGKGLHPYHNAYKVSGSVLNS